MRMAKLASGCRGYEGKNAELGQEYCRLFFSILLIEAPNTKDKIGYG